MTCPLTSTSGIQKGNLQGKGGKPVFYRFGTKLGHFVRIIFRSEQIGDKFLSADKLKLWRIDQTVMHQLRRN